MSKRIATRRVPAAFSTASAENLAAWCRSQLAELLKPSDLGGIAELSQEERFRAIGYEPFPWQWTFHRLARRADEPNGPMYIGLGGASGPGKTTAVFLQAGADDAIRYPGLTILYMRKTLVALKETLAQKLTMFLPPDLLRYRYIEHRNTCEYENGSRIRILYFQHETDIDLHLGQEWDLIVIEESTLLTPMKLEFIKSRLRTTKPGWRPRMYLTFNPGGPGHEYIKRLFVDRRFRPHENPDDYVFIPATIADNPKLAEIDPDYIRRLNSLPDWMRRAYRDGDWNISSGTFFSNWDERRIVIPSRDDVPPSWPMFGSLDYGYTHPTVFLWHAIDDEGRLQTVREYVAARRSIRENAEAIASFPETARLSHIVAGSDCFDTGRQMGGPTIAAQYEEAFESLIGRRIPFVRANTNRILGAAEMLRRLGDDRTPPTWLIWDRCAVLIRTIPRLQHDRSNPEDVARMPADLSEDGIGDDAYDAARYAIMSLAATSRPFFAIGHADRQPQDEHDRGSRPAQSLLGTWWR